MLCKMPQQSTVPAYLSSPFEASADGVARWRKVKGLGKNSSGGKEILVANQRPNDGLGLPPAFVVEKAERKSINPLAWDRVCAALAIMASMGLRHANVVKYYGAWHDDTNVYLVSEYCSGGDVFTAASVRPDINKREQSRQMLKGLEEYHRTGLVHPNVRLEDFRLSHDGSVKLGGCLSWGMTNDYCHKDTNIRQIGRAIYAFINGEHAPKKYHGDGTLSSAEDFFKLLLCEHSDHQPALSSALDHRWLSPSADADAGNNHRESIS
jgi:hypothetical protein